MIARHFICALIVMILGAPSGNATEDIYIPAKVVYDLTSGSMSEINNILDRASLLQNMYHVDSFNASIIVMVHGDAIGKFSKHKQHGDSALIRRARDLATNEVIQFRVCRASAIVQGFKESDFHEFTRLVPMADAEIVKLQGEGYAYLR